MGRKSYYILGGGNSPLLTEKKYAGKLREVGLVRKMNPLFAKIIICRNTDIAKKAAILFPFKKIVVHQAEPFVDTTRENKIRVSGIKPVTIVNGFNGGIFSNNFHFLSSYIYDEDCDLGMPKDEELQISQLMTKEEFDNAKPVIFVGQKRKLEEINQINIARGIDLNLMRQKIAECAYQKGVGDVIGRGWGEIAKTDGSGFDAGNEDWWTTKLELIRGYRFNIALENTLAEFYVTEKIWHSIKGGCLPVYWGKGSSIYKSFPDHSFVDASRFERVEELIDFMIAMHTMNGMNE